MKTKILIFCILFTVIFTSCEKDDFMNSSDIKETQNEIIEIQNRLIYSFAEALAYSLEEDGCKDFIYDESMKKFDGDANFLFLKAKDKKVPSSLKSSTKTFGEIIEIGSKKPMKSANLDFASFFDSISAYCPLLQIYVHGFTSSNISEINFSKNNYLVAYVPADFDEKTTKSIVAFNSDGKKFKLDSRNEPKEIVIVVSFNERLEIIAKDHFDLSKKGEEPYFETKDYYYYLKDFCIPTGIGNKSTNLASNINSDTNSDRDKNNDPDILNKAIFRSIDALKDVEAWVLGQPEMIVKIVFAKNTSGNTAFDYTTKIIPSEGWCHELSLWGTRVVDMKNLDIRIDYWLKSVHGDRMKYVWIESDGGWKVSFEVTISTTMPSGATVGGKVNIGKDCLDDEAGDAIVNFIDPTTGEGTKYTTGLLDFWIKQ